MYFPNSISSQYFAWSKGQQVELDHQQCERSSNGEKGSIMIGQMMQQIFES